MMPKPKNPQLVTFDLNKPKDLKKMRMLVGMKEKKGNVKLTPIKVSQGNLIILEPCPKTAPSKI